MQASIISKKKLCLLKFEYERMLWMKIMKKGENKKDVFKAIFRFK